MIEDIEWILWMKQELESKPRSTWDETDWDAHYYIESIDYI